MAGQTLADRLVLTTCFIETRNREGGATGTGFVYEVQVKERGFNSEGAAHFLITNKHVLEGATRLRLTFLQKNAQGETLWGQSTSMEVPDFNSQAWLGHPDPEVDVAAAILAPIVNKMARNSRIPDYTALTPGISYELGSKMAVDSIEDVTFVGYPRGIFDKKHYTPVVRRGITATPLHLDYDGKPTFLIDASVFPGSSGSPVFVHRRGFLPDDSGKRTVGEEAMFAGVVAAVEVREVQGHIVGQLPGARFAAITQETIDLGLVYKARCVDEVVEKILELELYDRVDN